MTYEDVIRKNCESYSPSWWPKFAYHYTDVTNAVSILSSGYLYSRMQAEKLGVMKNENASRQVIDMTEASTTSFARFYFRPLTPTQYHNEGYKHVDIRYQGDKEANVPVPVFLLFDLGTLLNMENARFSALGQAGHGNPTYQGVEAFARLPFDKIYSDGYCDQDTLQYRHAEILYPEGFRIDQALKGVFCRNTCERSTLLNILKERSWDTFSRYKDRIRVARDKTYYRNGLFVESALFHDGIFSFAFSEAPAKNAYARKYAKGILSQITMCFLFTWRNSERIIAERMIEIEIDYIKSRQLGFRMQAFDGATLLKSTVTIDHQILCVAEQSLLNGEII